MNYIAVVRNAGHDWFLRGTVWTGERDRATVFATLDATVAAIQKAKKFIAPSVYRRIEIRQAELTSEPAFVKLAKDA